MLDIHTHHQTAEGRKAVRSFCLSELLPLPEPQLTSTLQNPCSIGIHPWNLEKLPIGMEEALQLLGKLAQENPSVRLIGECGLDKLCTTPWNLQRQFFQAQIQLSSQISKPLIIHCVKAWQELLEEDKAHPHHPLWIVHGFNGSPALAQSLSQRGIMLSFGHQILNPRSKGREALRQLESYYVETDESPIPLQRILDEAMQLNPHCCVNLP